MTKEQRLQYSIRVRNKLMSIPAERVEVTALSKEEVLRIYENLNLSYSIEIWGSDSATYYKLHLTSN